MLMLGLNETTDQLVVANSIVCWHGYVLEWYWSLRLKVKGRNAGQTGHG